MTKKQRITERLKKRFGPVTTMKALDKLDKQAQEPIKEGYDTASGRKVGYHKNVFDIQQLKGIVETSKSYVRFNYAPGQWEAIFGREQIEDDVNRSDTLV